jgi:hypothetical protein
MAGVAAVALWPIGTTLMWRRALVTRYKLALAVQPLETPIKTGAAGDHLAPLIVLLGVELEGKEAVLLVLQLGKVAPEELGLEHSTAVALVALAAPIPAALATPVVVAVQAVIQATAVLAAVLAAVKKMLRQALGVVAVEAEFGLPLATTKLLVVAALVFWDRVQTVPQAQMVNLQRAAVVALAALMALTAVLMIPLIAASAALMAAAAAVTATKEAA